MHVVYELRTGGMEHGVVKLVNALDPARVSSAICSTRPAGELRAQLAASIPLFELHGRRGNDPFLVYALYALFRRERPDIVHTHAWGTLLEGLIAARLARVPAVVHGEHGTLQLRRHHRWIQPRAWASTDQLLSVSQRLAERIAAETGYPRQAIHTIRNGVDLSRFGGVARDEARRALGLPIDGIVVGTLGRLVPVKNQAALIDAVAALRASDASVTLVITGDGPLRDSLAARAASLGLQEHVWFPGHRADVERVLAALDVFVLPSFSEGLSNTILEAMASRLPVVATNVGGADELVVPGLTGVLTPPHDSRALAMALDGLIRDAALRNRMGDAGRRRVEAEFSLDRMVERYDALYSTLMATRRRTATLVGHGTRTGEAA